MYDKRLLYKKYVREVDKLYIEGFGMTSLLHKSHRASRPPQILLDTRRYKPPARQWDVNSNHDWHPSYAVSQLT